MGIRNSFRIRYPDRFSAEKEMDMNRDGIVAFSAGALQVSCVVLAFCMFAQTVEAEMKAGVAKAAITNDKPRVMVNGNVSEGVMDDIFARVLVLDDGAGRLVFVTYDLNCLDVGTAILRRRVRDELGIDPARLILLATHNHSAPIQIVPDNFDYGRYLADTIFGLIQQAIADERGPVSMLLGSGHGDFIRSVGSDKCDTEIQLLKVMYAQKPLALLFTHGTHPQQASEHLIEPGHPGYAIRELEARFPGVHLMYAASGAGNQFPAHVDVAKPADDHMKKKTREEEAAAREARAKAVGHLLAEAVEKSAEGEFRDVTGPLSSTIGRLSLPLAPPISREEALEKAKKFPADTGFVPYPNDYRDTNWVRVLLRYYEKGLVFPKETSEMICSDDTYLISKTDKEFLDKYDYAIDHTFPCEYEEVIVARIGPMPFVAMQGEICAPIVMSIKDAFRGEMPIFVTGYMGEHNLYIPTRQHVMSKAYQGIVIQIQYASPVGWSPDVEDKMIEGVNRMVKGVLDKPAQ